MTSNNGRYRAWFILNLASTCILVVSGMRRIIDVEVPWMYDLLAWKSGSPSWFSTAQIHFLIGIAEVVAGIGLIARHSWCRRIAMFGVALALGSFSFIAYMNGIPEFLIVYPGAFAVVPNLGYPHVEPIIIVAAIALLQMTRERSQQCVE